MGSHLNIGSSTSCDPLCAYCGRPVLDNAVQGASGTYHYACTQPPHSYQPFDARPFRYEWYLGPTQGTAAPGDGEETTP